jgi:hypothetical protein
VTMRRIRWAFVALVGFMSPHLSSGRTSPRN